MSLTEVSTSIPKSSLTKIKAFCCWILVRQVRRVQRKVSAKLEGRLISSVVLLRHILPYLTDSSLMQKLQVRLSIPLLCNIILASVPVYINYLTYPCNKMKYAVEEYFEMVFLVLEHVFDDLCNIFGTDFQSEVFWMIELPKIKQSLK